MARDESEAVVIETTAPESTTEETSVPEAAPTEEATPEATPSEATPENQAPEATPTEAAPAVEAGPSAEEIQKALADFEKLAVEIVATADTATGDLPEASISKAKVAYAALPATAAKTKARKALDDSMKLALAKERNPVKARAYLTLFEEVKQAAAQRETIAKPQLDPIEAYTARVASMYLASSFVDAPEGLPADWTTKFQETANGLRGEVATYKAYLVEHDAWAAKDQATRGDEPKAPEVNEIVVSAAKIARGRSASAPVRRAKSSDGTAKATAPAYTGPRRSIKGHIAEAFAGHPVGTFLKTGEVAKFKSSEYPDGNASSGAVQASFDSARFDVAGVQPAEQGGIKGAIKTA